METNQASMRDLLRAVEDRSWEFTPWALDSHHRYLNREVTRWNGCLRKNVLGRCWWWVWSGKLWRRKDWFGNSRGPNLPRMVTGINGQDRKKDFFFNCLDTRNYWAGGGKEDCEVYSLNDSAWGSERVIPCQLGDLVKGKAPDFNKYKHGIKRF